MTVQYGRGRRTAVVSGASSGIGAATARHLRDQGWTVVGLSRRRARDVDVSVHVDVARAEQVREALAGVGPPALVVHAAGVLGPIGPIASTDSEAWADAVATNLLGTYHLLRYALPMMTEAGSGLFVHVSSGAARHVIPFWSAYAAAKAGAEHLIRGAATELEGSGVGACAFNPGITETPMQEAVRASEFPERERFVRVHEERSGRTADEVGAALVRLSSREPSALNGLVVDYDDAAG